MGKSRAKKHKKRAPNPTGIPSTKEVTEEAELELGGGDHDAGTIATLIEKLSSPSAEERECACVTIASLVCQPDSCSAVIKETVIKVLAPLLLDKSLSLRHVAVGALRNMTVTGGHEACDKMMKYDVMTPLVALLKQYGPQWKPPTGKDDQTPEIFLHGVHVLSNLCESSDVAVNMFNREDLLPILLPCLQPNIYGYDLAVAVAQCLNTVTDSNSQAASVLNTNDSVTSFLKIIQTPGESSHQILLKTLATGILYNVSSGKLSLINGNALMTVIEQLVATLRTDTQTDLNELGQYLDTVMTNGKTEDTSQNHVPDISINSMEKKSENVTRILQAQQLVLEILSNLCCAEDENEEWEDLDSSDDGMESIVNEEEDMQTDIMSPLCVPKEVHTLFSSNNILQEVLNKITPPETKLLDQLSKHKKTKVIVKKLQDLQSRSLLCLNNIVSAVEPELLGGLAKLHRIWLDLTQLATTPPVVNDLELLEAVTSAMRAVIVKLGELKSPEFSDVTPQALQFIFEMGHSCSNSQVRANTIRIISTIGCMLALQMQPHPLLKDIGVFLLEVCAKDSELWVVAECLDAMFDVFSEDHLDPIMMEIGLVQKLKQISPLLKSKIHQQKRHLGEHLPIVMTARTNLIRFIKYKNG